MSLNDEQLDILIKERITKELQQIPIPSVDEEWLKFKSLVKNENKRRSITPKFLVTAAATVLIIIGSLTLFRPVEANAFGERFMQIFNHLVGKTTKDKTETINNNASNPPLVQNLGTNIEKETTLDEAQKLVYFQIAKPEYLPLGTTSTKVLITNISTEVYKIRMEYNFQGKSIILTQQNTSGIVSQGSLYDTDDTVAKDISINGIPASLFTDKSGVKVLTWHLRGLLLQLTGVLPQDEFLKIAQAII